MPHCSISFAHMKRLYHRRQSSTLLAKIGHYVWTGWSGETCRESFGGSLADPDPVRLALPTADAFGLRLVDQGAGALPTARCPGLDIANHVLWCSQPR